MKHLIYIIACFVIIFNVQLVKAQGDVKIGSQVWTSKNLDVSTFRNGEAIPEVKSDAEWNKAGEKKQPAWRYYDSNVQNGKNYGKLYNWYAVNDSRGLAPKGYHIPSDAEWTVLADFLGGEDIAGHKMKSTTGWKAGTIQNYNGNNNNGNNSSGFNGLPGGYTYGSGGFYNMNRNSYFWSSSVYSRDIALNRLLDDNNTKVYTEQSLMANGFSVRCLRD